MMKKAWVFLLTALGAAYGAVLSSSTSLQCEELIIPVDVAADNFALPSNLTLADLTLPYIESLPSGPRAHVQGRFTIGARYCQPTKKVTSRQGTLQILVHGITYTRDYWSGLAAPGTKVGQDEYSWILYAANQGYPTLSIDRLCNGLSSHPNGIIACQLPLEAETVHAIIDLARCGQLPGPSPMRKFDKIVVAGHSEGSLLSNALVKAHPRDVDALLLTGFSFNLTNAFPSIPSIGFEPANRVDPAQFGNLGPSYLEATNKTAVKRFFYFGRFSQAFSDYDYAHRGTVALGEVASVFAGQQRDPSYRGKLFVLNGEEDAAFCETSLSAAAGGMPGDCSAGFDQIVQRNYPSVSGFDFHNTPQTGHCLNLHLTAQQSYKAAHDFLERSGFG